MEPLFAARSIGPIASAKPAFCIRKKAKGWSRLSGDTFPYKVTFIIIWEIEIGLKRKPTLNREGFRLSRIWITVVAKELTMMPWHQNY